MSDRMGVPLARRLAGGEVHNVHAGLVMPAARAVVAHAEQLERLQSVIRNVDASRGGDFIGPLIDHGALLSGDMEPPA